MGALGGQNSFLRGAKIQKFAERADFCHFFLLTGRVKWRGPSLWWGDAPHPPLDAATVWMDDIVEDDHIFSPLKSLPIQFLFWKFCKNAYLAWKFDFFFKALVPHVIERWPKGFMLFGQNRKWNGPCFKWVLIFHYQVHYCGSFGPCNCCNFKSFTIKKLPCEENLADQ